MKPNVSRTQAGEAAANQAVQRGRKDGYAANARNGCAKADGDAHRRPPPHIPINFGADGRCVDGDPRLWRAGRRGQRRLPLSAAVCRWVSPDPCPARRVGVRASVRDAVSVRDGVSVRRDANPSQDPIREGNS